MEYSGSSCSTARATVIPPMPESKMPIIKKECQGKDEKRNDFLKTLRNPSLIPETGRKDNMDGTRLPCPPILFDCQTS
jgi:hypothetical protein